MGENKNQWENFEATIKSIKPMKYGDMPNTMEMQSRYDMWMSGGAKPDVEGSSSKFMSTQFHIAVYRSIGQDNLRKIKLRAWTNMPLYYGDVIETSPYLGATIEFTEGGIAYLKTSALVQILNREAQDLNYGIKDRLMKIFDKTIIDHNYDAPTINHYMSIKG